MRIYDESKSREYYKETSEEKDLRHAGVMGSISDDEDGLKYTINGVPVNDSSGKYFIVIFLMIFSFPLIIMIFNIFKIFKI